jgi:hypothetical protein
MKLATGVNILKPFLFATDKNTYYATAFGEILASKARDRILNT